MVQWSGVKEPVCRAADQCRQWDGILCSLGESTEREGIGEGWGGGELYTRTMHICTVYIVSWMQQDKVAFVIAVYSDVVV